jgi:hypothetical protein
MSKISDVYDALIQKTSELFPSKTRLHNPYNLDENPDLVKKDAWGIKVEDASREVQQFCDLSVSRQFTLVLVKNFVSLASKENGFDAVTAALLDSQQEFCLMCVSPDELGQQSIIDLIDVTSISGIQEIVSGEKKYLFSEVTFTITISDQIV